MSLLAAWGSPSEGSGYPLAEPECLLADPLSAGWEYPLVGEECSLAGPECSSEELGFRLAVVESPLEEPGCGLASRQSQASQESGRALRG